jgi:hypothetical protein
MKTLIVLSLVLSSAVAITGARARAESLDDKEYWKKVKAKITSIKCGYGKPRSLELKGGALTLLSNNEENNFGDFANPWLKKHL